MKGSADKAANKAAARRQEEAQQRAEREERDREEREERRAAAAARHGIRHELVCPMCGEDVVANMANDGETTVRCKQCKTRLRVDNSGEITALGPKGKPFSGAEDPNIKEERLCGMCKSYLSESFLKRKNSRKAWIGSLAPFGVLYLYGLTQQGWFGGHWAIGGLVVFLPGLIAKGIMAMWNSPHARCSNETAVQTHRHTSDYPQHVNPNGCCKFWEKK